MSSIDLIGLAARWLTFATIMLAIGAIVFRVGVLRRAAIGDVTRTAAARRSATIGAVVSAVLVLPVLARLVLQTAEMRFPDDPWSGVAVRLVAHTDWGTTWLVQLVTAVLLAAAFTVARRGSPLRWIVAGALTMLLAATPTMASHARSAHHLAAISSVADALHVIAAGSWLGTLGVMFISIGAGDGAEEGAAGYLVALLRAFSPLALVSAAIVALSGTISAFAHIANVAELFGSRYGQTLIAKLVGVAVVLLLGFRNWRFLTPAVGEHGDVRMRRSMVVELLMAAIVVLVTAALVVTPPPMEGMGMP